MDHPQSYSHSIQELIERNSWKTGYYDNWRNLKLLLSLTYRSLSFMNCLPQSLIFVSFISDHKWCHMSYNG